jgi:hypothetical protein
MVTPVINGATVAALVSGKEGVGVGERGGDGVALPF